LHCLSCSLDAGARTARHDRLCDVITNFIRRTDPKITADREYTIIKGQMKHKCDVRVQLESGESFYLDVSVYNPSCASLQNETPQTLMAKKVAAKRVEYKHVGISSASTEFVPVIFDSTGNLCPQAISFFKTHFPSQLFRLLGSLNTCLASGNSRIVHQFLNAHPKIPSRQ
jgi:hypothetical protein